MHALKRHDHYGYVAALLIAVWALWLGGRADQHDHPRLVLVEGSPPRKGACGLSPRASGASDTWRTLRNVQRHVAARCYALQPVPLRSAPRRRRLAPQVHWPSNVGVVVVKMLLMPAVGVGTFYLSRRARGRTPRCDPHPAFATWRCKRSRRCNAAVPRARQVGPGWLWPARASNQLQSTRTG